MKLYTFDGSPNCRKVEAVIFQLNLQVQREFLDLGAGDQQRPEYTALNANAMVPALVDGEFVLWESNAIMQYLAEKTRNDDLLPRDAQLRADVLRWQTWEAAHFNRTFGALAFEIVVKPLLDMSADAAAIGQACSDLARQFSAAAWC